jgi:hypothetical protein
MECVKSNEPDSIFYGFACTDLQQAKYLKTNILCLRYIDFVIRFPTGQYLVIIPSNGGVNTK